MKNDVKIGVLGLWHLGSVYSAALADQGFKVVGYDEDKSVIDKLKKGIPPIQEPLLKETVAKHLNNNLIFTNNPKEAVENKNFVFVTYDIPVDEKDKSDLTTVNSTFSILNKYISPKTTVVVSSQVPIGYCRKSLEKLRKKHPTVDIIYFPENLRLGNAFESFLRPDRIVVGSTNPKICDEFEQTFSFFKCPVMKMGLESAEMVKHSLNSYLALIISFSSEMGDLSEILGANMNDVVAALKTDKRVSPFAPLSPGLGFAGGTLGRDLQTLRKLAKEKNYKTFLLDSVYKVNQTRLKHLMGNIKSVISPLKDKNIGILGVTYKPKTSTLRRSMSLELAKLLDKENATIKAFDPAIKEVIPHYPFIKVETSIIAFFNDLDLVILMTEWEDFKKIDWTKNSSLMGSKIIFDCKNLLNKKSLEKIGFKYFGIGYPK